MNVADFRTTFPEFGASPGTGAYTDARINFWIALAEKLLISPRWDNLLDHGIALFVAHHLAMDAANLRAAATGGAVGQTTGPLASKSVDKVAAAYTTGAVTFENAGHWNLTTYGVQFYQLVRMVGAGGVELTPALDILLI